MGSPVLLKNERWKIMEHIFEGKWITDREFTHLIPRNVFHKEIAQFSLDVSEHRDRHILFRKHFVLDKKPDSAVIFISADDYYKLYINGSYVCQGPTCSYHFQYGYNTVDVTPFLKKGENVLAVHTLYQGLINRVWVSGDFRHGLLCDLVADGITVVKSDESFLTQPHGGYSEMGIVGYQTQYMERQDSRAKETGFEEPGFDDNYWQNAVMREYVDYTMKAQTSKMLTLEEIKPQSIDVIGNRVRVDFGCVYVGYVNAVAKGTAGSEIEVYCGQELNEDGSLRWQMRCNCAYKESWVLSGGDDKLEWFDYKSLRYVEFVLPVGCEIKSVSFTSRHYPFTCTARLKPKLRGNKAYEDIWNLCVRSMRYGIQDVIQDCMDREKGFYLGDGCMTTLVQYCLTGDDSMMRKMIDDAFASSFVTDTLLTCSNCSLMQEIAEYPLMLVMLLLQHYRLSGDIEYLRQNYEKAKKLMEAYRFQYETKGLLSNLDRWCVVEWPDNFRDGYDVDIREGKVCTEAHVAINAYYLEAIHSMNSMAAILGTTPYRNEDEVREAIVSAFYDEERHLFKDGINTQHTSYVGNVYAYAFRVCPDKEFESNVEAMIEKRGIHDLAFYSGYQLLCSLARRGMSGLLEKLIIDEGAWLRIITEGGRVTFEGWGKETKWNTSLFHLTIAFPVLFMMDMDAQKLFE